MPNRTSPIQEAQRRGRWLYERIGRELRVSRLVAGMTQRQLAARLAISQPEVSRREHGAASTMNLLQLARHAAMVGLTPSVSLFPIVRRPLDRAQLELLGRLRARIGQAWHWSFEVPMPTANDLRAGDAVLRTAQCTCLVEAYTRFIDHQAQVRSAHLKKRDLGVDRLVLLIADTRANRAALRAAAPALQASFPIATRQAIRAMAAGQDPGGDALIVL